MNRFLMLAALAGPALFAQTTQEPVVLTIDVENYVQYRGDVFDLTKIAKDPNPTTGVVNAFLPNITVGDIVAVNGKPAKGLWQQVATIMPFRANPTPGQPIADMDSGGTFQCTWEILGPDGSYIGTLVDGNGGAHGHAVRGGLGAFIAVTGTHQGGSGAVPSRGASFSEDPSKRRLNGGGKMHSIFYVYPAFRPTVQMTATGPAVSHLDYSPVTTANPARPGESLIIAATGLGPVKPDLLPPGTVPFSGAPYQNVNAPVTVTVNGQEFPVINAIGWPGQRDLYWINFQLPSNAGMGTATLQLTTAWIPGPTVTIPVGSR
jgi:hypothetical protein